MYSISVFIAITLRMLTLKETSCLLARFQSRHFSRVVTRSAASISSVVTTDVYRDFLANTAYIKPPAKLDALIEILQLRGEEIVGPNERKGLNPFIIPLSKGKDYDGMTCFIRWPTQKEDMDLQLVRTNPAGVTLLSTSAEQYCKRIAVELDFYADSNAIRAIELVNKDKVVYNSGDFMGMLKSGKFPTITADDLRLVLDRFILTKVGSFPDCYERISRNFLNSGSAVSALVTCERSVSVFYGWGHPVRHHSMLLNSLPGREKEARDAAKASLGMPGWTVASSKEELAAVVKLAGFTDVKLLGEMHAYRANDPRTDEIGEGLSPMQVTLDQAAHLMDAVAFGSVDGGWDAIRDRLAEKYHEGGYPEMAKFILSS